MKSFVHRWNLTLLAASLIPLLISFILVMAITGRQMRSLAIDSILKGSEKLHTDIESRVGQIGLIGENMSNYVTTELSRNVPRFVHSYEELRRFESFKNMVTGIKDIYNLARVRVFTNFLPFVRTGDRNTFFLLKDLDQNGIDLDQLQGSTSIYELNYVLKQGQVLPAKGFGAYSLISFYRCIYDMQKNLIAVVFLEFDEHTFLVQSGTPMPGSDIFLENTAGELFCVSGQAQGLDTATLPANGYLVKNGAVIFRAPVSHTDWILTVSTPIRLGANTWSALSSVYVLILLLASALSLGAGTILSFASVRRLKTYYEAVREADFTASDTMKALPDRLDELTENSHKRDEVDQIMSAFAALIRDNLRMLDGVRQRDLNIEKYKLQVLQEQINPHFLYNALDTLRLCMTMRRPDDALRTLDALTRFYRIALSRGRDTVTVGEEMDMIRCYLEIENVGYDGGLKWNIQIGPMCADLPIPKFLIQPLIENSIVHGKVKEGNQFLTIDISVCVQDDMVIIRVADDGIGIEPEALERLNYSARGEGLISGQAGFGLFNVSQRLKLFYGSDYGLIIQRGESGTENIIRLPVDAF